MVLMKELNKQSENKKGQRMAETCTLQVPAMPCPACPERSRRACPESLDMARDKLHRRACPSARRFRSSLRTSPQQRWNAKKGQQILEYAFLIVAISSAFLAMFVYTKRGLQAMIKASADQVGLQRDSERQVTGLTSNTTPVRGLGNFTTLSDETTHIRKLGHGVSVDFSSYSSTSGNGTYVTESF